MQNKNNPRLGLCWAAVLLSAWCGAYADAEPENVIKYRQNTMKALGGHMGATAQIVRGKVNYPKHLVFHAESIDAISRHVGDLFPEGSDFGETKAKDAVWDKPDEFQKATEKAENAAADYLMAAKRGDKTAIQKSFRSLAEACKGCHKKFREKED